jgi:hypothetical protein
MLASIHDVPKPRGFHHIMSDVLAEHDCNTKRKKHFASWVNKCSRSIYGVKYIYIYQARNTSRGKELVEMGPR